MVADGSLPQPVRLDLIRPHPRAGGAVQALGFCALLDERSRVRAD
jgi:hypothetical protein